ncbi:MAG: Xaa-Pro aminopeptidase [Granulosicoccus sp.]|nr:Xaa-Pro aminopeptidase [Granulosicoccus sp.]
MELTFVTTKTHNKERLRRRKNLMRIMGDNAIAILPAAPSRTRSRDTEYRYRQDSDFQYLSGFDEPESIIVLLPGRKAGEYIVFCRESDPQQETWHGRRLGVERAPEVLEADDAFPITDLDDILPGLLEGRETVFYSLGKDSAFDVRMMGWINRVRANSRSGFRAPTSFVSLDYHLHEMRVHKSRTEIALMRKAAKISGAGHMAAMQVCQAGIMEYELEAALIGEYKRRGATHSFLPIVGGGDNGCILHYTENNRILADGDLVLVDSGAEYQGYAGDITRTYPVNGVFSQAQRDVYQVVLDAQLAAIEAVKPGNHWNDPHDVAVKELTRGLIKLGLLKGTLAAEIKSEGYRRFYMHRTGHWLGLDVHDVGEYKVDGEWRLLEPGMVLTIEPGLYIGSGKGIPKRYANIGIRIEDDVAVTRDGYDVLTSAVPKTIDAIEALLAKTK